MLKTTLLTLSIFISVSLGLIPTLEKSLFFLRPNNGLSNEIYQTRNGILAYSIETIGDSQRPQYVPQYLLIDIASGSATPVLANLITYCGQGSTAFDRAHYHVATATLVYYCANNNSLLIIDEDDFSVQQIIDVNTATIFSEVKLTTDGYSVAILGMGPLYTENPIASELIRVNLQSRKVVNHIVFNYGLAAGEAVYGYASDDNNNLFVSTYTMLESLQGKTKNQTIYSMTLIANSYTLAYVASFSTDSWTYYIDQLYCVGELLFTVLDNNLSVLEQNGNVISKNTTASVVAHEYGSLDFYALVNISLPHSQIVKFSAKNTGYTLDYIGEASDINLVFANKSSNSLLFTIDPRGMNFTILDLLSQETIYATNTGYEYSNGLMLTNTTYCFFQSVGYPTLLQIYDRKTNLPISSLELSVEYSYYYDEESAVLSYVDALQIVQIDLQTGVKTTPAMVSQNCFATNPVIIHATNKGSTPQFTIKAVEADCFVIISEKIGQVQFNPLDNGGDVSTLVFDYDSVTIYRFEGYNALNSTINATIYTYNATLHNLEFSAQTEISGLSLTQFYPSQKQVVAYAPGIVSVIDLPSLSENTYQFQPNWTLASSFEDSLGNAYTILSEDQAWGQYNDAPGLLYGDGQYEVYGTTDYTIQASASGLCSYWIVDGLVTSVGVVRFYNTCNQDEISAILA